MHYFHSIDGKRDFLVYNQNEFDMTDADILPEDLVQLKYKEPPKIISQLKSEAWSCGCNWFFVLQPEGIYLMNVYEEDFWLCRKHSSKFIEMYLNPKTILTK